MTNVPFHYHPTDQQKCKEEVIGRSRMFTRRIVSKSRRYDGMRKGASPNGTAKCRKKEEKRGKRFNELLFV